jgi:NADH:ubiquinone oxidoreductase subunit C
MTENTPKKPEENTPRGAEAPAPKAPAPTAASPAAAQHQGNEGNKGNEAPKAPAPASAQATAKTPAASAPAKPAATPAPVPAPAPLPNPLAHLAAPFQGVDFKLKGFHADASVGPDQVVSVAEQLDKDGFSLDTITGVDWPAQGQMEVVYDYFHPLKGLRAAVRARIPRDNPELPTISEVFPGANWHERETHDFFGIRFLGHPNLTPFLLPEDADYHPLKKDFKA